MGFLKILKLCPEEYYSLKFLFFFVNVKLQCTNIVILEGFRLAHSNEVYVSGCQQEKRTEDLDVPPMLQE